MNSTISAITVIVLLDVASCFFIPSFCVYASWREMNIDERNKIQHANIVETNHN